MGEEERERDERDEKRDIYIERRDRDERKRETVSSLG